MITNILFQIGQKASGNPHEGLMPGSIHAKHVNIMAYLNKLLQTDLFKPCLHRTLVNIFSLEKASEKTQHDLLAYRAIGEKRIRDYITYTHLKTASCRFVPSRQKLNTFAEKKPTKTQTKQKEKDQV